MLFKFAEETRVNSYFTQNMPYPRNQFPVILFLSLLNSFPTVPNLPKFIILDPVSFPAKLSLESMLYKAHQHEDITVISGSTQALKGYWSNLADRSTGSRGIKSFTAHCQALNRGKSPQGNSWNSCAPDPVVGDRKIREISWIVLNTRSRRRCAAATNIDNS